jgi:hypothetical protein
MDEGHDSAWLRDLHQSLRYEVWSLALVVLGIVVYLLETGAQGSNDVNTVGSKILEYTVLTCFVTDSYFSVVVTGLFLKPVLRALKDGWGMASVQKSVAYKKMQQTVYMTMFGSSLAVLSSTYLYINLLLFFDGKTYGMRSNPWLNPLVTGNISTLCCRVNRLVTQVCLVSAPLSLTLSVGNVVSILNDVGMLFVSGVFKHASWKALRSGLTGTATVMVQAPKLMSEAGDFIHSSKANDEESS